MYKNVNIHVADQHLSHKRLLINEFDFKRIK